MRSAFLTLNAAAHSFVQQPLRRNLQEKSDGEEDCKLELLAGNHLFARHDRMEGGKCSRSMAGAATCSERNHILVILQRWYFVFRDEHRIILPVQG
jgi:hypothetical protein